MNTVGFARETLSRGQLGRANWRRVVPVVLATVLVASVGAATPQAAAIQSTVPQTEIAINRNFDGTSKFDDDPLNNDETGAHTPGLDANDTNYVVRTHDGFGVRIDWDVNEKPATGVTIVVAVESGASTPPTDARVTTDDNGVVAGCDPELSSMAADELSYTCVIGDVPEGSHGTILPQFVLNNGLDGTPMNVTATISTNETAAVSSGPVTFFVSEGPKGDWLKQTRVQRRINEGKEGDGYVIMFPLALRDNNQVASASPTRGAGPIKYGTFDLYDHGYKLPTNSVRANGDQMEAAGLAGDPCGVYDGGNGVLKNGGQYPVNPNITVTCSEEATKPYLLTKLTIAPVPSADGAQIIAPAELANGKPNSGGLVFAAQIAFFVPLANAEDKVTYSNALSAPSPLIDPDNPVIEPAAFNAEGDTEVDVTNNTSSFGFGSGGDTGTGPFPGGTHLNHYGLFSRSVPWAPYNRDLPTSPVAVEAYNPLWIPFWPDPGNAQFNYQAMQQNFKPGSSVIDPPTFWDGNGLVTRGTDITMNLVLTTSNVDPDPPTTPIQGCMNWSLKQVNLKPMAPIELKAGNVGFVNPNGNPGLKVDNPNYKGEISGELTPSRFNYLLAGQAPPSGSTRTYARGPLGPTLGSMNYVTQNKNFRPTLNFPTLVPFDAETMKDLTIVVEYAQDPTLSPDAPLNGVDCNNTNPDTGFARKWLNLDEISDADLATYEDPDQPGTYLFNMVRVRTSGTFPWSTPWNDDQAFGASGIILSVSGVTGNDVLGENKDGTEILLHTSRSAGEWDPATADAPSTTTCYSWYERNPPIYDMVIEEAIKDSGGTTEWCNMRYLTSLDRESNSARTSLDPNSFSWASEDGGVQSTSDPRFTGDSDSDRLKIVGVKPAVKKENRDGLYSIADNGQLVTFDLTVSAVGADIEALTNYVFTDTLAPQFRFVSIDDAFPNTPGASCTTPPVGENGTITCQLSEPDPLVDTGELQAGLAGGWSDTLSITVEVRGAIYDPGKTYVENEARVDTSGYGPWDSEKFTGKIADFAQSDSSSAASYLPMPYYKGDIVKSVATGSEPCANTPPTAPSEPKWSDRCSMTTIDDSAANQPKPDTTGNMTFTLSYTNTGIRPLTNLRVIDVLPFNNDDAEPGSNSGTPVPPGTIGADPSTVGDGRTPASDFVGEVGFKDAVLSFDSPIPQGASDPTAVQYLFTADDPTTISRDPAASELVNTWCTSDGTVVYPEGGKGTCPSDYTYDVTGVMAIADRVSPNETANFELTLDAEANSCSSLYTNTFGARVDQIWLPIRSNDVSYMVKCEFDQALQKRVKADWKPGADWVTYGKSTVDFEIEVVNQGVAIEDFDVTDYVDTTAFEFVAADNPAGTTTPGKLGTTGSGPALAYTWSGADGTDKPTVKVTGKLAKGESTIIPIRLRVTALDGALLNNAEISRFDDDGDASNGDSDPANPNNTTAGPLIDIDSTPDTIFGNDVEIDNEINLTPATGDEDDEDVAMVPWYDLALVKDLADGQKQTVVFDGETALVNYVIIVKNQGLYATSNVKILDTPPAGFAYDTSNKTGKQTLGGVTVNYEGAGKFTIERLAAGQTVTIPVVYQVTAATAVTGDLTNIAEIYSFADAAGKVQPDVDSDPDTNPTNDAYTDPEGGKEADGGESPDFDVDKDGDLHNRSARTIDEDDHDKEIVKVVYSLGNQVWVDANNNGKVDADERGVPNIEMLLFTDTDGDGTPDDRDGSGTFTEADALASTTTDGNGLYLFSDLQPGSYFVAVSAKMFEPDYTLALYRSSDPTSTNPDDNIDQDDNGVPSGATGMVMSGPVTIGGVEPLKEPGPDNDSNADALSNLTVDFGFYSPEFDLALRKTLATEGTVQVGDLVTFTITIFNQGDVPATGIEIVDYPPATLLLRDPNWMVGSNGLPTRKIAGTLRPGESTAVQITFVTTQAVSARNNAEIMAALPVGTQNQTLTYQNNEVVPDIDSVPDDIPGDIEIDDEINLTPETGDEDDEDVAFVNVVSPEIPESGGNTTPGLLIGSILLAGGLVAYAASRRRRQAVHTA